MKQLLSIDCALHEVRVDGSRDSHSADLYHNKGNPSIECLFLGHKCASGETCNER